jgi:general stress protein 26
MPDRQSILDATGRLLEAAHVGVLTTVDAHHLPHSRYMAAVADEAGPHRLYSLSAKETSKVRDIQRNPHVCWAFMHPDGGGESVTLSGTASVYETTVLSSDAWYRLSEVAEPYAMNAASDPTHHAFVALVTQVETLIYLDPANGLTQPQPVHFE